MSRKDYERIARAIRRTHSESVVTRVAMVSIRKVAYNIALELQNDNPRFDRSRFMEACGLEEHEKKDT